jgi:hypothetical protein
VRRERRAYLARPRIDAGAPGSLKRLPMSVTTLPPSTFRIETSLSV